MARMPFDSNIHSALMHAAFGVIGATNVPCASQRKTASVPGPGLLRRVAPRNDGI